MCVPQSLPRECVCVCVCEACVCVGVVREPTNHSAINGPIQLSSVGGAAGMAICLKRTRKCGESVRLAGVIELRLPLNVGHVFEIVACWKKKYIKITFLNFELNSLAHTC